MKRALAFGLAVFAGGCWSVADTPLPSGETPSSQGDKMQAHFDRTTQIRQDLVNGRLERVSMWATQMVHDAETTAFPSGTKAYALRMQAAAAGLGEAANHAEAAQALGILGTECGDCHRVLSRQWETRNGPIPLLGEAPPSMIRHAWAMDRLWEGLIWPSEKRWQAGAQALMDPAKVNVTPSALPHPKGLESAHRMQALAEQAFDAHDPQMKAELFGLLIETCASCHESAIKGPLAFR